jgi:hypothetical protein
MTTITLEKAFRGGLRVSIAWLHARADEMADPHAKAILNTAAHDLGVAKLAPTPTPEGEREAIARIIDPWPFLQHETLLEFCILEGDGPEESRRYADQTFGSAMEAALSKADQILARRVG